MPLVTDQDDVLPLQFNSVKDTIEAFKKGEFVIILDDANRENEGDLIIAADAITPEKMAFLVRYSSGLICAPILPSRADVLTLPLMVPNNEDPIRTAYTVSIDANHPTVTTGISAYDRSLACQMLAGPNAKASDFRRPGHILPLRARPGGVRVRRGHTEATVDLCRLAGKFPAGVIAELVEEGEIVEEEIYDEHEQAREEGELRRNGEHRTVSSGTNGLNSHTNGSIKKNASGKTRKLRAEIGGNNGMMRRDGCLKFGRKYGLKVCTIEDMANYLEEKNIHFPINEKSETILGTEQVGVSEHLNGKHV